MKVRAGAKRAGVGEGTAKAPSRLLREGLPARPESPAALMKLVQQISAELLPQLPHVDPGDVSLIVESLLRPAEQRVVFVRPLGNGIGHVF